MTNSRNKGATYERDLCRAISVWWCGNPAYAKMPAGDLPFRRTPLSGGWDRKAAASDILVVDPKAIKHPWCFAMEAKNQECWDWSGLFKGNDKWPVKGYWAQCMRAATDSKLLPLLIFTKNRELSYVALDRVTAAQLKLPRTVDHSGLPFVIGYFDDLVKLDPAWITSAVAGNSKIEEPHAEAPPCKKVKVTLPSPYEWGELEEAVASATDMDSIEYEILTSIFKKGK